MIVTLSQYAFMAALRDKIILSFLVLAALGISLSIFLGSAAVIEREQFSIVYAAGGLRILGVLGLVLFVVFYIRRSFEDKDIEFLLSRPVSRPAFILAHSLSFSFIALCFGAIVSGCVFFMIPQDITAGHLLWAFSILCEYVIIANAALFFSMVLPSATMASLAVFGFYIFCRIIGQIFGIVDTGTESESVAFMGHIVEVISIFVPRLDLMGQTSWLVYGAQGVGYVFVFFQMLVFSAVLVVASMIDLVRRQF